MNYSLIYSQVSEHIPYLLGGATLTLELAAISFLVGWAIGLTNASILHFGPRPARLAVQGYVTFFINTPLLVQIFFIFFVLPDAGILLSPYAAVAIGMSLNAGAYLTETAGNTPAFSHFISHPRRRCRSGCPRATAEKNKATRGPCRNLERETRLELATSTLARLRSTN